VIVPGEFMYLKLALRDLRGSGKFAFLFILNLSMGLVGFTALDTFKTTFQQSMGDSSRNLLTADIEMSARRKISKDELDQAINFLGPKIVDRNEQVTLYSMVSGPSGSRLAEVKAVEQSHPLYGKIGLKLQGTIATGSAKDILGEKPLAWIYPELLSQLGAEVGGTIKIGVAEFRISDILLEDSGLNWAGASVAPRVYIGLNHLAETELIRPGSSLWNAHLFKVSPNLDAVAIVQEMNRKFTDAAINIKSHQGASEQTGQLLRYLNDYLGLVALTALFLACLGSAFLYRGFLTRKMKDIAILLSLGATSSQAMLVCLIQLGILGTISAVFAFGLSSIALPLLPLILKDFLPTNLNVAMQIKSLFAVLGISIFGSILMALPLILRLRSIKASELFQEHALSSIRFHWRDALGYIPGLLAAWGLAIWQAHSVYVGSVFILAFLTSAAVIGSVGTGMLSFAGRSLRARSLALKLAVLQISRNKLSSVTVFLALGLGTLMLNLIPQIKAGLETEISMPQKSKLPSLFMFDIQDDQVDELISVLKNEEVHLNQLSPMIRAKLVSINGEESKKIELAEEGPTREEQRARDQRNRNFNLSYRKGLADSETLVEGRELSASYEEGSGKMPEISLEFRFAARLGIKLGDILAFDIQGVPVKGTVVNLRKVRWTSFQPNFFIQFQSGVLDAAPKTFVAAIPGTAAEKKSKLQNLIVNRFSNISIIDVSRLVQKILEIVDRMSWVLSYMAWLTLAAGFVVLFSIADFQVRLRQKDTALLKVLGSDFGMIQASILWEFGMLGVGSSFLGATLAIGTGWILSWVMFDSLWVYNWQLPLLSAAAVSLMALIAAYAATARILRLKPLIFLQDSP
jgi:putative ABC transport system permease protein